MSGSPKETMSTIVFPNSDYKRPPSAMSSTSSMPSVSVKPIKRSHIGSVFLSCYVFVGIIFQLISIGFFIWACLALVKIIVVSNSPIFDVVLGALIVGSIGMSLWIPTIILFGKKDTFRKYQKTPGLLLYGTVGVLVSGVLNIAQYFVIKSRLNGGIPVGVILIIFSGLTLKIFYDLKRKPDDEVEEIVSGIIVPYKFRETSSNANPV